MCVGGPQAASFWLSLLGGFSICTLKQSPPRKAQSCGLLLTQASPSGKEIYIRNGYWESTGSLFLNPNVQPQITRFTKKSTGVKNKVQG